MVYSLRDLLLGLIDYAGLFPPAALDMSSATRKYAEYREGECRWALGRFVVPVARLDDFEDAAVGMLPGAGWAGAEFCRLRALVGADLPLDLMRISEFNQKRAGAAIIDTIEIKAARPTDIEGAMGLTPTNLTPYFEIPIGGDPTELIKSVAETEA